MGKYHIRIGKGRAWEADGHMGNGKHFHREWLCGAH